MPRGLERRYDTPSSHFITCSCYHRQPWLTDDRIKRAFLCILEELRREYRFCVYGYVLMPEHFHLLISKPGIGNPGLVLQVLKQRVGRRGLKIMGQRVAPPTLSQTMGKDGAPTSPPTLSQTMGKDGAPADGKKDRKPQFWQRRFYDFNVCTPEKRIEKLRYMHRNPVKRGLVEKPEDWPWSSFNTTRREKRV